jgi:hypothetical protein
MAKQRRKRGTAGDKTICLPLADDLDYATLVADREAFRQYLDQQVAPIRNCSPQELRLVIAFTDESSPPASRLDLL